MNHVQISHPALVALQGRLKAIQEYAAVATEQRMTAIDQEASKGIEEIDRWLTDPAKQVTKGG